jgi:hypothetical protein
VSAGGPAGVRSRIECGCRESEPLDPLKGGRMKRVRSFTGAAGWGALLIAALLLVGCAKKPNEQVTSATPPPAVELGITVLMVPAGIPNADHFTARLSKGEIPNKDHVRWKNESGQTITITFKAGWPFYGSDHPIVVENGKVTEWFTLGPQAVAGVKYPYGLMPNIIPNEGGPTDPSISGEP